MAEINSIANGSFVLGNTNELTFSAGPGISIDSPSEGVVRIGNDETVLWSGVYSGTIGDTNYITLSERPDNFETIEITNGPGYYSKYRFDGKSDTWSFMQTFAANGNTTVYANRYGVNKSDSKVTCLASNSFGVYSNNTIKAWSKRTNMDVGETQLTKVIGINRISGSNA